jgi:excinuclease UvrABC nuclease subunit
MKKWERHPYKSNVTKLPAYPKEEGVYIITDSDNNVYYIGCSKLLCRRASHLTALQPDKSNAAGYSHIYAPHIRREQEKGNEMFIRFIISKDYRNLEKELKEKYKPIWNKK